MLIMLLVRNAKGLLHNTPLIHVHRPTIVFTLHRFVADALNVCYRQIMCFQNHCGFPQCYELGLRCDRSTHQRTPEEQVKLV